MYDVRKLGVTIMGKAMQQELRGELQRRMVTFLRKCPAGVVILEAAHMLPAHALPALIPALSEGGQYMHDGVNVPTSAATYILSVSLSGAASLEWLSSERVFTRRAKDSVADTFAAREGGSGLAESAVVEAFRRRIDFVAPFL